MQRAFGSQLYKNKLARYRRECAAHAVLPDVPEVMPEALRSPTDKQLYQRDAMHALRMKVLLWTGLNPQEWEQLPVPLRKRIVVAIREYYAEMAEPRTLHGGMFDSIAAIYGGYPWRDWAVDDRGLDED